MRKKIAKTMALVLKSLPILAGTAVLLVLLVIWTAIAILVVQILLGKEMPKPS